MSRVALPEGWRAWPLKAQEELLAGLEALAQERETGRGPWLCDIPDCDGRPHKGRMNEHSRAEQRPPADPDWDSWLLLAGRGFGKTRTGAEWVLKEARRTPVRIALIGATAADVRDIMVEGESGIMACARSAFRPEYQPSKRRVVFPNGSMAFCYSADEPERLRGPQHHIGWCVAWGEPVLTERGWVPIEDVRPGERVQTRRGMLPSTGAVLTKQDAELVEVVTESGEHVVCTPDHRIATPTGWAEASNIVPGDTIVVWNSPMDPAHRRNGSRGADDVTTDRSGATTATAGAGCCTGMCGPQPTGTSPRATSSTTSTTTRPTTGSTTCKCSPTRTTSGITPSNGMLPGRTTTSTGPQSPRRHGPSVSPVTLSAPGAGSLTRPRGSGPSTAAPHAAHARVVRVSRLPRRADVYDIGVPGGGGEFVAGGVVVHNCDELAAWRYLQMAWDMYQMGLRLGEHPRTCITTTPRPLPLIKELVKNTERVRTVRGSTYANLHNLAPVFQRAVLDRYAGTTLGRQELDAEILNDMPGALVRRKDIGRVAEAPEMTQVVVGVDPAGTGTGDEAGIVVVGHGADGRYYVLADLSGRMSARETGLTAWKALYEYGAAHLVYEDNFGKQWLRDGLIDAYADHHRLDAQQRAVVRDESTAGAASVPNPFLMLRKVTAQHGKVLRAQPVAMRYEQGKVSHVGDHEKFEQLEGQLCTWDPHEDKDSPDRIDALVHAVTHLMRRERSVASVGALPHQLGVGRAAGASVHPLHRSRRPA